MPRPYILAGLLGASVAGPYLVSQGPAHLKQLGAAGGQAGGPNAVDPFAPIQPQQIQPPPSPGSLVYSSPAPIEGIRRRSLAEVFRFDVTKEWVYGQFARKTTGLADPELFGVRVPLVTGTGMGDLAGSLTYYFSRQNQVDRITFHGKTADTRPLVQFLTSQYGLTPTTPLSPGEQLLQRGSGDKVESELRSTPQSVLWSTDPHTSFLVDLDLNRPGSGRFIQREPPRIELPPQPQPVPILQQELAAAPPVDTPEIDPTAAPQAAAETVRGIPNGRRNWFRWPE